MSVPQLGFPGMDKLQPVTASITGAVLVLSLLVMASPQLYLVLCMPVGHNLPSLFWQVWRPFTATLLAPSFLSLILAVVFTYLCGASAEAVLGVKRFLLVAGICAATAGVLMALSPSSGLINGTAPMVWGWICAVTVINYARGYDVRSQLLFMAVLLLVSLSSVYSFLLIASGAVGGGVTGCVIAYLPQRTRRVDDWSRKVPSQADRIDRVLYLILGVLIMLWMVLMLSAMAI